MIKYQNIKEAEFISRPNRFIAYVLLDGKQETVHVKNTGRCKELLVPGAQVFIQECDNPNRKTKFDLIAVMKGNRLINMDSQVPNKVCGEWLEQGNLLPQIDLIKAETKFGDSRFDFYVESKGEKVFIEVKGVTLEDNGVVLFPDAPTARGVKHIRHLISCLQEGYQAYIIFLVQMADVQYFTPNSKTHLEFAEALKEAETRGVKILALSCQVTADTIVADRLIPVKL